MAATHLDSEKEQLTSGLTAENGSFSETPPQELSPEEEDTKLLLKKGVAHEKGISEAAEETQGGSTKMSARSSLISFAAAPGKSKLFDKSLGDKSIKHSILKDSCEEESPPSTAKLKDQDKDQDFAELEVVPNKASQFGFGSSTSDSYKTLENEGESKSEDKAKAETGTVTIQKKDDDTKGKSSKGIKNSPKPEKSKGGRISATLETVTLETSGSTALFSSTSSSRYNTGDKSAEASLLQSPQRSEGSSEDDSPFLNTSEEADNFLSPSNASDDGLGVCSKYSQLSEDGSSPSSPGVSAKITEISAAGAACESLERGVFEHALELGVAFTEFVDVDSFKASLENKNPHTEDGFGGRSEEHLVALLQSGATKNLKSYLRNSQWPAESDARRNQWLNLCGHLVKAGGGLYQELAKDVLTQGWDSLPLPQFVDTEHLHCYHLNQHGVQTIREVVNVIAHMTPDIIYCPVLYPLACVFLHYMTPEACFDCLQALLASDRVLYLAQAKMNNEVTALVLRDLAKKYAKQAYVLIVRSSKNVDTVFESWIWWIFKDLPFQFLVRIIDSYLLEGYKVFFRVALSILMLFTKDNNRRGSRNSPVTNISAAISRFCSSMPYEPRKLIKAGFSIRGLTRKEIQKLQAKHETHMRAQPVSEELPMVASTLSVGQTSLSRSFTGPGYLLNTKTDILSPDMLHTLWGWIPIRLTLKKLERLFSSDVDGTALRTLYMRSQYAPQTLLIIKATDGSIFGAFCSAPWSTRIEKNSPHMSFFGTGETFVFTMYPSMKNYVWAGATGGSRTAADHFMAGDDDMLIIGSGNGEAIYIDNMMNHCRSAHCDTFDNDPLCESQDFSCQVVEVFGFVD